MINHYEILGLSYGAGIAEIKASFRQLAKLYHPDKNPQGIEHFAKILKAYEVLSDPALKASYDYKLNYHQAQTQYQSQTTTTTKTWKSDERELKRRQYYNDHIKKYAKQTSDYMAKADTKKNYNEFKYILFATPLAVLLFLLIMHLATRNRQEVIKTTASSSVAQNELKEPPQNPSALSLGDAPYTAVFGPANYQSVNSRTLTVKNMSGREVIVCLFTEKEFIRCFYIAENISAEVSQLPAKPLYIYYSSGTEFDYLARIKDVEVLGAFTKDLAFYKSMRPISLNTLNELTLLQGTNEGFERTDAKGFFKYAKTQL